MRKLVFLWLLLAVICLAMSFRSDACAYTYDGEIDPQTFFTYQPLLAEQLSEATAMLVVGKENASPRFVVVCIMRVQSGVIILAYAYYDEDYNFRHFMIEGNHYAETPFDRTNEAEAQLEDRIKKILNAFRQVTNV